MSNSLRLLVAVCGTFWAASFTPLVVELPGLTFSTKDLRWFRDAQARLPMDLAGFL